MREPFIKIDLPSGFAPYDQKEIGLKPLEVRQIKRIFSLGSEGVNDRVFDVLNESVSGIKMEQLTAGDFWFVLHWIRFNTFASHPIYLPWTCPHCSYENNSEISQDKLNITHLEEPYIPGKMRAKLPDYGVVNFRLQCIGDEQAVENELTTYLRQKRRLKPGTKINLKEGDMWNAMLAQIIEPHGGDFKERFEKIESMSPSDLFQIQGLMDVYIHGIDPTVKLDCSNIDCKKESEVRYTMSLRTMFPSTGSRGGSEASRSSILPIDNE